MDVQRLEEERKLMLGMQKQLADSGQDPDLNVIFDTMIKSGNPDYMSKGLEGKFKLKEQEDYARAYYGDETPKTAAPALAPTAPGSYGAPLTSGVAPAPTNALAGMSAPTTQTNALAAAPMPSQAQTVDKINRLLATGTPRGIQAAQVLQSQLKTEAPRAGIVVGAKGTLVNPVTGEVIFRNTAGGEGGLAAELGLSKKDLQKREMLYPQATQAVDTFEAKITQLEKDLARLKNHPGLPSITGILAGRAPGLTAQGREAQALFDKIVARGGFKELQEMRAASPTGGALGNISNREGDQLRQAFAAIDRRQDAPSVQNAIDEAINEAQDLKSRVRTAYDMTYEYKGSKAPKAPPKAPDAGGSTVTTPDGKVLTFPSAEAAAQFKKAAGIKD